MTDKEILKKLKSLSDPKNAAGMARFALVSEKAPLLGIPKPVLRKMAKEIGRDHKLAQKLWRIKIHETRNLAALIDDPAIVSEKQMEKWVKDFDEWGTCDNVCGNLFDRTEFAYKKVFEWADRKEEFVRRAAFATIAGLAVHDKKAKDSDFVKFFPLIKKYSTDERNYVRKAVNWALRQIGKRNLKLNTEAIKLAREILKINSKSARWIAGDALRELQSKAVQKRMKKWSLMSDSPNIEDF